MRQEAADGCSQLQVPGPGADTETARCLQGPDIGGQSFSHSREPPEEAERATASSSFPSGWDPGLKGVRFCRGQTWRVLGGGPASAGPRPPPRKQAAAGRANTAKGRSDRPTAHTAHGGPEQLPRAEENQTAHTAQVLPRPESRPSCHLLVLLPAGSVREQRQAGSAGRSEPGPG